MRKKHLPERELAFQVFQKTNGRLDITEMAEKMHIDPRTLSQWKYRDKWEKRLQKENKDQAPKKKKAGGQLGNQNAKGHGAPKNNKNAEIHGGYSKVDLEHLSEEDKIYLANISLDTEKNFIRELKLLLIKEKDIRRRIELLDTEPEDSLYLSRESEINTIPKPETLEGLEPEERIEKLKTLQPTLKTIMRDSKFERQQKLLNAFDRIHGRIIKLLDSIKTYQLDHEKIEIDKERYNLAKEKIKGVFEFDLNEELDELE